MMPLRFYTQFTKNRNNKQDLLQFLILGWMMQHNSSKDLLLGNWTIMMMLLRSSRYQSRDNQLMMMLLRLYCQGTISKWAQKSYTSQCLILAQTTIWSSLLSSSTSHQSTKRSLLKSNWCWKKKILRANLMEASVNLLNLDRDSIVRGELYSRNQSIYKIAWVIS